MLQFYVVTRPSEEEEEEEEEIDRTITNKLPGSVDVFIQNTN